MKDSFFSIWVNVYLGRSSNNQLTTLPAYDLSEAGVRCFLVILTCFIAKAEGR
jgi:hypothetical protein